MYNVTYPPLQYHSEESHCPKNSCAASFYPSLHPPLDLSVHSTQIPWTTIILHCANSWEQEIRWINKCSDELCGDSTDVSIGAGKGTKERIVKILLTSVSEHQQTSMRTFASTTFILLCMNVMSPLGERHKNKQYCIVSTLWIFIKSVNTYYFPFKSNLKLSK